MIRTTRLLLGASLALTLGGHARGQTGDANPLAGPSVASSARAPTLVDRGYDGALRPLDAPAEIAALDLLDLTSEDWAEIEPVLESRAEAIDRVVLNHIRTLVELQSARASGDIGEQRRLTALMVEDLRPLQRQGRFIDQVARVLPAEKRDRYKALVRERHLARYEEIRAGLEGEGVEHAESEAFKRLIAEALGQEIQRSYDRVAVQQTQRLEELLRELDLDLETEGEVRRLVTAFGQRTALNPTPEERRSLFAQIYRALPPDAQGRLLRVLRGRVDD
ncbi:MAG: hypothetical protein ACIARR_00915 [Phycisphaerales bacterium JB059]